MLQNKVALITGGSRGIGRATALEFARCGADIAILYAGNTVAADDTVAAVSALGVRAKAYLCDVADFEATKTITTEVISDFSGVDILVNNAGITRDGLLVSMSEENFDAVINTNLKGAFHMIRHLYGHMLKKRSGRIINITSVSGMMGNIGQANYASAKSGMIGLTKTVAKELASRGITCNAIAPGFIESDMSGKLSQKAMDAATQNIPLKRLGKPEDIAKAAAFLASDAAAYITGETLKVDGGLYI